MRYLFLAALACLSAVVAANEGVPTPQAPDFRQQARAGSVTPILEGVPEAWPYPESDNSSSSTYRQAKIPLLARALLGLGLLLVVLAIVRSVSSLGQRVGWTSMAALFPPIAAC